MACRRCGLYLCAPLCAREYVYVLLELPKGFLGLPRPEASGGVEPLSRDGVIIDSRCWAVTEPGKFVYTLAEWMLNEIAVLRRVVVT